MGKTTAALTVGGPAIPGRIHAFVLKPTYITCKHSGGQAGVAVCPRSRCQHRGLPLASATSCSLRSAWEVCGGLWALIVAHMEHAPVGSSATDLRWALQLSDARLLSRT